MGKRERMKESRLEKSPKKLMAKIFTLNLLKKNSHRFVSFAKVLLRIYSTPFYMSFLDIVRSRGRRSDLVEVKPLVTFTACAQCRLLRNPPSSLASYLSIC